MLREFADRPDLVTIPVHAMSMDASMSKGQPNVRAWLPDGRVNLDPWGEFYPPDGPIVIWQIGYELMPDQENYYPQIKAVFRHEFGHVLGEEHEPSPQRVDVTFAGVPHFQEWVLPGPWAKPVGDWLVTVP